VEAGFLGGGWGFLGGLCVGYGFGIILARQLLAFRFLEACALFLIEEMRIFYQSVVAVATALRRAKDRPILRAIDVNMNP
jgi:hypothetical protein